MDTATIANLLELIPSLTSLLLDPEADCNTWLAFTLTGEPRVQELREALYTLIPHGEEVKVTADQEFTYPSIVRYEDDAGYMLVCSAEDKILLMHDQFGESCQRHFTTAQAHQYLTDQEDGDLIRVDVTGDVTRSEVIRLAKLAYIKLMKKITTTPVDELTSDAMECGWVDADTVSDEKLVIQLLEKTRLRYRSTMDKLRSLTR